MTPAISDKEVAEILADSPFHEILDLSLVSTDTERQSIRISIPFNKAVERAHGFGQYHGGVIASFIDIAGCYALIWALGIGVPTINFRVDYLRPAFKTTLYADAIIRKIGRSVGVVDIDVFDDEQRLVAVGRGCYGTKEG